MWLLIFQGLQNLTVQTVSVLDNKLLCLNTAQMKQIRWSNHLTRQEIKTMHKHEHRIRPKTPAKHQHIRVGIWWWRLGRLVGFFSFFFSFFFPSFGGRGCFGLGVGLKKELIVTRLQEKVSSEKVGLHITSMENIYIRHILVPYTIVMYIKFPIPTFTTLWHHIKDVVNLRDTCPEIPLVVKRQHKRKHQETRQRKRTSELPLAIKTNHHKTQHHQI